MTSKVCDVRSRGCRLEVPGSPKREKFHGQMTKAVGRTFTISAECRVPCAANGTTVDGGVRTAIKIHIASSRTYAEVAAVQGRQLESPTGPQAAY